LIRPNAERIQFCRCAQTEESGKRNQLREGNCSFNGLCGEGGSELEFSGTLLRERQRSLSNSREELEGRGESVPKLFIPAKKKVPQHQSVGLIPLVREREIGRHQFGEESQH